MMGNNPRCLRMRGGSVLVWTTITMFVIFAFASLAMDYGRVQVAKTELRRAADSAARAGASALGSITTVQDRAQQLAGLNMCDGSTVQIHKVNDVEFGLWDKDARTFTPLAGISRNTADAVRVTCKRTGANAIPLVAGRVLGQSFCDVQASSIASVIPPGFGLVGLDYITLKGNSSASYWSATGTVGGNAGNVASNGNISSSNNAVIQGTIWKMPTATVSGVTANVIRNLSAPLVYPNGDSGTTTKNSCDNYLLPSSTLSAVPDFSAGSGQTVNFPTGKYWFRHFSVSSNAMVNFLGPVTIYFYGNFTLGGNASTYSNTPKNLTIVGIPSPSGGATGYVDIGSGGALYGSIYAPQSNITLSGSGSIYGSIVGKSVSMTGTSDIYYDLSGAGGNGVIQVVR